MTSGYVTDLNDVIARKSENGDFQVAEELKNASDWRLFNELIAQADVMITGSGYLKRVASMGSAKAQNVLDQFSEGGKFADLGEWRLNHGFDKRNPDIAIVSRSLDFDIPEVAFEGGRKVVVFTTFEGTASTKARGYQSKGAIVVGAGEGGVDGKKMYDFLAADMGYKVAKMTTGPRVLKILLDAGVLDELYITRVNRRIEASADDTQTVLGAGKKIENMEDFVGKRLIHQGNIQANDGAIVSQDFWVYEKK